VVAAAEQQLQAAVALAGETGNMVCQPRCLTRLTVVC
jgi:hypothetical protein